MEHQYLRLVCGNADSSELQNVDLPGEAANDVEPSYFAVVVGQRVAGLHPNVEPSDRVYVERIANVLGAGTRVFRIVEDFPANADAAIAELQSEIDEGHVQLYLV